jgi:uncharacterized protein YjlB
MSRTAIFRCWSFAAACLASNPEKLDYFAFEKSGWVGVWTDPIYDYTHFHSNAHEVLGIAEGNVTLRLGGEDGRMVRLNPGDMLVLPAGVGHRIETGDFALSDLPKL